MQGGKVRILRFGTLANLERVPIRRAGRWKSMPCAARTKAEARALQRELELKSDRQRKGLEPLPTDRWASFDEMLLGWLDGESTRFVSHDRLKSIYATHFKGTISSCCHRRRLRPDASRPSCSPRRRSTRPRT